MSTARESYDTLSQRRTTVRASGSVLLGADGAVETDTDRKTAGFSVSQIIDDPSAAEAGRYLCTFDMAFNDVELESAVIVGAADAAYTTGKGISAMIRGKDTAARTCIVQFMKTVDDSGATYVDANPEDDVTIDFSFLLHLN